MCALQVKRDQSALTALGTHYSQLWEHTTHSSGNTLLTPLGTHYSQLWEHTTHSSGNTLLTALGTHYSQLWEHTTYMCRYNNHTLTTRYAVCDVSFTLCVAIHSLDSDQEPFITSEVVSIPSTRDGSGHIVGSLLRSLHVVLVLQEYWCYRSEYDADRDGLLGTFETRAAEILQEVKNEPVKVNTISSVNRPCGYERENSIY